MPPKFNMWAFRRAGTPLRSHGYHVGVSRASSSKLEKLTNFLEHGVETHFTTQIVFRGCLCFPKGFHQIPFSVVKSSSESRGLSSQAGTESSEEDDNLEDRFSELETPKSDIIEEKTEEGNEDLVSEPDFSDDDENSLEASLNELDSADVVSTKKLVSSDIFKVIIAATSDSLLSDLNKWDGEGSTLDRSVIISVMLNLRKRRMYVKALQFLEWLESKKKLTFSEKDYASRLDLIAKVRGIHKAEKYIADIPESLRGEIIYRTLLANCVVASNKMKGEEVFNKMRDMEFQVTAFACNQLLLLYKRLDKKKIADVLLFMDKQNIKPTVFTYRLLIDTKGRSNDITGMEQLLETMKEQGLQPDIRIQAMVARHYIHGGFTEKAEAIVKEMDGLNLRENREACRSLLTLYANLGKADEVGRIWKVCDPSPRMDECVSAIEAWGKLGKIEEAEAVFEKMAETWNKLPSNSYTTLLKIYADHKMLTKGKDLAKRMGDSGCRIGPWTWDALVNLYVEAGELGKADSILYKAVQQKRTRPLFSSYIHVMDQYARKGDIHNAEKVFHRMKQAGYVSRIRQYQTLLDAYVKAKAPAYGFKERMRADEIFPNKVVLSKLAQIDPFKKTALSELLD